LELNFEGAQEDVFQGNGFHADGEGMFFSAKLYLPKLVFQLKKFAEDLAKGHRFRALMEGDHGESLQVQSICRKIARDLREALQQESFRHKPLLAAAVFETANGVFQLGLQALKITNAATDGLRCHNAVALRLLENVLSESVSLAIRSFHLQLLGRNIWITKQRDKRREAAVAPPANADQRFRSLVLPPRS
jgi:hypothetical protein